MPNVLLDPAAWGVTLAQLLAATVCGGLIGFQRERQESAAGFRTHILVCVGSAIFMLVSVVVGHPNHDDGRIAAQVATGIGFLGAGTIIKHGSIVRGLTTAASLWAVAAIGLAIGFGIPSMIIAILGTLMVFLVLGYFMSFERYIGRAHNCFVSLTVNKPYQEIDRIREELALHNIELRSLEIHEGEGGVGEVSFEGRSFNRDDLNEAINAITHKSAVRNMRCEYQ